MDQLLSWLSEYTLFFSAVAGVSIVLIIVSLAATPWLVASLPIDYLLPKVRHSKPMGLHSALIQTFRNIVGVISVILGIILMFTPGPGLVVLLLGISVAEFPGKHRLLISIAIQPNVFKSLNWMRTRGGKPPFVHPDTKP
jgi:hypothetical protein